MSDAATAAAKELRSQGLSAQVKTRVIGQGKSNRSVLMVTGKDTIDDKAVLNTLKKHKVPFATVRSQRLENGKHEMMIRLVEGVAPPLKKFKKGQIVTVKKTGEKVEVMSQNDIGLVFTAAKDALKVPNDKRLKVVPGRGYKEYMPSELED